MSLTATNKINTFLVEGLLPLATHLLCQSDLEPFYGQRILSSILEKNIRILKIIRNLRAVGDKSSPQQPE